MDDLKVYAEISDVLSEALRVVDRMLHAVGMEFGLRKCAVIHIKRGKYVNGENYLLEEEQKIESIVQGGTYWYFAIEQVITHPSALHTKVYVRQFG